MVQTNNETSLSQLTSRWIWRTQGGHGNYITQSLYNFESEPTIGHRCPPGHWRGE